MERLRHRSDFGRTAARNRERHCERRVLEAHLWGSRIDLVAGYCFERIVSKESVSSALLLLATSRALGPP
jgi:hypothetical protein